MTSQTSEIRAEYGGVAKIIVAAAIALAVAIGLPLGLVDLSHASHDRACASLATPTARALCLTLPQPSLAAQDESAAINNCYTIAANLDQPAESFANCVQRVRQSYGQRHK